MITTLKHVEIHITEEDIERGQPYSWDCPIAHALQRELNVLSADVHSSAITLAGVYDDEYGKRFYTWRVEHTEESLRFMELFDDERTVTPQTLEFDVPAVTVK